MSFAVVLLFAFPLKFLCKLCGAPYIVLLVLSGLIACVNTLFFLSLKNNEINISSIPFFRIFSLNICLMFLMFVIGYPIIKVILSIFLDITIKAEVFCIIICIFRLLYSLFDTIFTDKYLPEYGPNMSSYDATSKLGKNARIKINQILHMDNKGESSKTSPENVGSSNDELSKRAKENNSNKILSGSHPFALHPIKNTEVPEKSLPRLKELNDTLRLIKNPEVPEKSLPRLKELNEPLNLPNDGIQAIPPKMNDFNNVSGPNMCYDASLKPTKRTAESRFNIGKRQ
jgi:hypothetical protein